MKRSRLMRRTPLRARRKRVDPDAARWAWKTPRKGACAVCGAQGLIFRHHVIYEQAIRRAGRPELAWDQRNALDIGAPETCTCHHDQHWAVRRIPRSLVSVDAREFAIEVLGYEPALLYFLRFYGADPE